jgi:CRISP-associated protein Cas1
MIGKVLEVSQNNRFLSLKHGCMHISDSIHKTAIADVALDDIDGLILSGHGLWHSSNLLAKLAEQGTVVVITNNKYLPVGILIGTANNVHQGQRIIAQHDASSVVNKRIWQEIVQSKLSMQASLLYHLDNKNANNIKILIKNVKSGDPSNLEAQGAKYYWQGFMSDIYPEFRRNRNAEDGFNIALNYGYIVLRTAIAKSILATGLHTGWGIHHCHPNNTMPLADDMMEPFRPMIDAKVHALAKAGLITPASILSPLIKKSLVNAIYTDVCIMNETKPLLTYLHTFAYSLVKIYLGEGKMLAFPDIKKINWEDFEVIAEE